MSRTQSIATRRGFLQGLTLGLAAFTTPGLFAETLKTTASTTEGPFYPDKMPLDTDNDLLIINDAITPAVGQVTHLTGRVLTATAQPVRNAFVEIWQVDSTDLRAHPGPAAGWERRELSGVRALSHRLEGPVLLPHHQADLYTLQGAFRTAHIHMAISRNGKRVFTSQLLVKGLPENAKDGLVSRLGADALATLLVDFKPFPGSKIGELSANWEVVLSKTLEELEDGKLGGGVAISGVQRPRR